MLAAIEWDTLAELLYVAPLAGLVVAVTFAVVIYGAGRAEDARRNGNAAAATTFGVLTVVALVAFLGFAVFAIMIIAS